MQAFSERVGVSKSAIRYYESKGLLGTVKRNVNGYRLYHEEQIETVRLIVSLRMADIAITEIQEYLKEESDKERQRMMRQWIHSIQNKREVLGTSLHYLNSNSFNEHIYLIEKGKEAVIWFPATSQIGKFGECFMERREVLKKQNIPIQNSYLRYMSGTGSIVATIGFGIPIDFDRQLLEESCQIEEMDPMMCIAMPFTGEFENIKDGYAKLLDYAVTHEWRPTGPLLEWYRGESLTTVDLLLPVTQIQKEVNGE